MTLNSTFTQTITVNEHQTAESLGSGGLPVFATPAMIALMENTAMKMMKLPDGNGSVGVAISTNHLKASPVGATIHCEATIVAIEGRKYSFTLRVTDGADNLIGEGTHDRVEINIEKFMSKVS